jgi:hypothetical protein
MVVTTVFNQYYNACSAASRWGDGVFLVIAIPREEVIPMTPDPAQHLTRPQASGWRLTVSLIPEAEDHLRQLQERTNMSKTDLVNRAITSHEFIDAQLRAGHELMVRDSRTGETRIVWLF